MEVAEQTDRGLALGIAVPTVLLVTAVLVLGTRQDQNVPIAPTSDGVVDVGAADRRFRQFIAPFTYMAPGWSVEGQRPRLAEYEGPMPSSGMLGPQRIIGICDFSSHRFETPMTDP
jgi:hypothetical protein